MEQQQTNEDKSTKQFKDYARFVISGSNSDDTAQAITDRINTLKGIIFNGRKIEDISDNEVREIQRDVYENRKKILKAYEDFQKDKNTSNIKKTINDLNQRFQERLSSSQSDTEDNEPSKLRERVRSITSSVSSNSKQMLKTAMEKAGMFTTSIGTKIASATPPGNNAETNIANYTRVQDSIVGDPLEWFELEKADTRTPEKRDEIKIIEARRRMNAIIKLVIKYKGHPGYDKIREEGKKEIIGMYTKCFGKRANLRNLEDTYEHYTKLPTTEGASVSSPSQVAPSQLAQSQVAPSQVAQSQDDETVIKDTQIKYKTMNGQADVDAASKSPSFSSSSIDDIDWGKGEDDPLGVISSGKSLLRAKKLLKDQEKQPGEYGKNVKFYKLGVGFDKHFGSDGGKRRRRTIKKNRRSIRRTTIRRRQYKNKNKNNRSFKK